MNPGTLPLRVVSLAEAIRDEGGRALLVGGCVRDRLLSKESTVDWDLEVYGVDPLLLRSILEKFGQVDAVGEAFTVYKLSPDIDVSIPRRERKSGRGHRSFTIEGDPSMSIEEATRRRDFTVNSILEDPLTREIIDPFNGREDLDKRVLRAVSSDTFPEDSLRVLRAARFTASLGFDIEKRTAEICRAIDVTDLPCERIWGEMEKLLLAGLPSVGIEWLVQLQVVDQLFPEIKSLIGVPQEPEWHPEGDVFVHTKLVVERACEMIENLDHPRKITVMLAALCHDFGKPPTTAFLEGKWRSRGHEEAGKEPTAHFLDTLNIQTIDGFDVRKQVIAIVGDHLKPGEFFRNRDLVGDGAFRRLAAKCEMELLYRVAKADSLGRNAPWVPQEKWFDAKAQDWFIERVHELGVVHGPPDQILKGRHLIDMGVKPGPEMGKVLATVYEMQLDGRVTNLEAARAAARELIE